MSMVRITTVVDHTRHDGTSKRLVAQRMSTAGEGGELLASLTLCHGIGSQVPRYWYYVGQVAFASQDIPLYRHDRMLVLGNDLIGADELAEIAAHPSAKVGSHVWQALIQTALHTFSTSSQSRVILELPGRQEEGQSPFWRGLGRHFCPIDPRDVRERFGEHWSAHVAALLPQQPVLVSLLSEGAQSALQAVDDSLLDLQRALMQSGFRWCRHVSIHDGGPVYEHEAGPAREGQQAKLRAHDSDTADGYWLIRADHSTDLWIVEATYADGVLGVPPEAVRLIGDEVVHALRLSETPT